MMNFFLFRNSSKDEEFKQLTNSSSKSTINSESNTPSDISSGYDFVVDKFETDSVISTDGETRSMLSMCIYIYDYSLFN